ncbi:MAG: hypothetical protein Q8P10_00865 [bacterium]|nr:hypothetical protein [bacterium]
MKLLLFIFSFFLIFLFVNSKCLALVTTDVNITANGTNVKSNVSVQNNVNSQSSNEEKTQTDIIINTNGNVKEYHSDKNESVNIQSEDGTVKINVNNKSNTVDQKSSSAAKINSEKGKSEQQRIDEKKFDFFKFFQQDFNFLKNLFSSFFKAK